MEAEWIEWVGGGRPVHGNVRIDVKLRDGRIIENVAANALMWPWTYRWARNIVAYRKTAK